jgi:hypothetical protein
LFLLMWRSWLEIKKGSESGELNAGASKRATAYKRHPAQGGPHEPAQDAAPQGPEDDVAPPLPERPLLVPPVDLLAPAIPPPSPANIFGDQLRRDKVSTPSKT